MRPANLLLSLFLLLAACQSATQQEVVGQIDAALSELERAQQFSGAVLISKDGNILISKGYGMADRERHTPNTPQTRYRIHWVTMPITAIAITLLQAEGRLNLYDEICPYIPECPANWQGITLHHLLTHTSGVADGIRTWESEADKPTTGLGRIELISHGTPFFEAGEQFRYSENGYILLGYIIEKVSGQGYGEFLKERIFNPLGMVNSGYDENGVAVGYTSTGNKVPVHDPLFRYSASGLYSSVEDLYRLDQALDGGQFITQADLEQMFTGYARTPSADFEGAQYGHGWFTGKIHNRRVMFHGGMMNGFSSMIMKFPDERVTIIVLRNYGIPLYDQLEIKLAKTIFGEP